MDCVYICRSGNNEELRYSIRSVLKNTEYKNIWIVGHKPDWYVGNYIPVTDIGNKYENIQRCLDIISTVHEISEDFILMNDDFFIMNKIESLSSYYDGTLEDRFIQHMSKFGNNQYARILATANKKLRGLGIETPLNYDIHSPMIMNRYKLKEVVNFSLAPRSFYGNIHSIGGESISDVKLYKKQKDFDADSIFLSTTEESFEMVKEILMSQFPEKSKYEI